MGAPSFNCFVMVAALCSSSSMVSVAFVRRCMASRRRRLRDTLTEWLLLCSDWVSLVDDRRPALVAPGLTDDTDDAVPEDDPDDEDPDDEDDDPDVVSDPDSSSLESSA